MPDDEKEFWRFSTRGMIQEAIKTMDVPNLRRDTTKNENIRWLSRNLGIKNRENKLFPFAIGQIKWFLRLLREREEESK